MKAREIYEEAGLMAEEVALMPFYIDDDLDFYSSSAFEKLFEYFAFETGEMPYGTAKARDGMPDEWIIDRLVELTPAPLVNHD